MTAILTLVQLFESDSLGYMMANFPKVPMKDFVVLVVSALNAA